jgi:hypothetical protein
MMGNEVVPSISSRGPCHSHRGHCLVVGQAAVARARALLLQSQHSDAKALLLLLDVAQVTRD